LMNCHFDELSLWWVAASMNWRFDELPLRWIDALMSCLLTLNIIPISCLNHTLKTRLTIYSCREEKKFGANVVKLFFFSPQKAGAFLALSYICG
jgi:hypothetical protein